MESILIAVNIILAIILIGAILLQRSEGGALGLGVSQDNFTTTRTVGNFLTKFTAIIATLFIVCSIIIVSISRDQIRETQSVLEKQEESDSNLPQIPQSNK
jgi:preprotein translocase subunit SecG|tara:strand:- start:72 stop:374 length:303 start_codon:yes stop_codon:yes gene_type:complete